MRRASETCSRTQLEGASPDLDLGKARIVVSRGRVHLIDADSNACGLDDRARRAGRRDALRPGVCASSSETCSLSEKTRMARLTRLVAQYRSALSVGAMPNPCPSSRSKQPSHCKPQGSRPSLHEFLRHLRPRRAVLRLDARDPDLDSVDVGHVASQLAPDATIPSQPDLRGWNICAKMALCLP